MLRIYNFGLIGDLSPLLRTRIGDVIWKPISDHESSQILPGGRYHSECYWEEVGRVIEAHPIGVPGRFSKRHPW
jgi:hypothetical protein